MIFMVIHLKNKTNIYLTPSYPTDRNLENGLYINPTYSDSADINPLFEKIMCVIRTK